MNWMVTSSIHGGTQYAPATRERYTAAVASLRNQAKEMKGAGFFWSVVHDQLRKDRASAAFCPALAGSGGDGEPGHVSMPYARLLEQCVTHARECATLAGDLEQVADLIVRAHSLYDEAETKAETKLRKAAQIMTTVLPNVGWNTLGMLSLYGFVSGSIKDGKLNPVRALDATSKMDEELLASLAGRITNNRIAHILGGTQVAGAAERIAKYTSKFKNAMQGNKLTVREVQSTSQVAGASHSVASSMENLRRLAEERLGKITLNSGLSYATIAVQRYRRSDGTTGWLILIPGTDGQDDSPFGWEQNLELMSSNANRRRNADSFRMVEEAMKQAGIGKDEPVALVGHSQGGIVAAALASDLKDSYTIDHVVTAGSPVANHPIPPKTWVTSIEIEDELVASLDGGRNPSTEQWLTVRGKVTQTTGVTPPTVNADGSCMPGQNTGSAESNYAGALVADAPKTKEISHWLKYHQAAYRNATDLGSPAVDAHERHFQQIIDGELIDTRYYEGRMSHD